MGDSLARHPESTHLYTRHHLVIPSPHRKADLHPARLGQFSPSPSLSLSVSPSTSASPLLQPHSLLRQPAQSPHFVLLHPLLQFAHLERLPYAAAALAAPLPAVIVSPQRHNPASTRDSLRPAAKNSSTLLPSASRAQLDGNNGTLHSVPRGAPSMTLNGVPTMGGKREENGSFPRSSQRPPMVSQHSSSVPSTPLQLARQYESHSRSPSPNGGLGSHSPRSVSSEANGAMPTLRTGRPYRCKYETTAAFGRRRIPYHSSDLLEKAKEEPKKTLDPHEDEKLSGDMRELYDRLLPTADSTKQRGQFVDKLEHILHTEWPGNEFKVHVFGSTGNLLYTSESDVDICIQTPMKRLEEMHGLAEALAKHGMERVVCIPQAKVRIVKVWDPVLELACDMNVNNTAALENTRMIKAYVQIDARVRPLAMIIKYWTKQRILNDAAVGGTISSYAWICMILNFLQTRDPPIIPSLHKLRALGTNPESGFADDVSVLRGFGEVNKETLGQLLFSFFRYYGHELDYEKQVISVREGKLLTREEKTWHLGGLKKEARNRLCVEEPFNMERNLGNSADDFAWRGIHLEIRRAFDLLAEGGQLDKMCEQFEFPPEEKTVFKKPTSSVKPILQTPNGRGRGGYGHRGGRGGYNQKGSHGSQRRASSSTTFPGNRVPFLNSPPIPTMPGQEYFSSHGLNEQLHDQLYQQYISLEMQSTSLRARLAAHQRQQAHVHAAQLHAHVVAQAQAHAQAVHHRGQGSNNLSPQKSPYMNGRASPHLPEMALSTNPLQPQFVYQYPAYYDPTQVPTSAQQDGPRTNPSSPSLNHSALRRSVHRAPNSSDTAGIRSQSQPPRGALLSGYSPVTQYYDASTLSSYPIARSTQEGPAPQVTSDASYSAHPEYSETTTSSDSSTPKEYVGYYVEDQPHARQPVPDYSVPQIPLFHELRSRRRVSPEIVQPLLNTAFRRVSRSPSPLRGHMRSYSTDVGAPPATGSQRKDRIDSTRIPDDSGPVIVNGSITSQPRDSRNQSPVVKAHPIPDMSNMTPLGIYTSNGEPYRMTSSEARDQLFQQELEQQRYAELVRNNSLNSSMRSAFPLETHNLAPVANAGKQSLTTLPDPWLSSETTNGHKHSPDDISPTRTQPQGWRPASYSDGLSRLDTLNAPRAPPTEIQSASLPLLSPVFETRTPSPAANRQSESSKLMNGNKAPAKEKEKENQQHQRRASHATGEKLSKENGRNHQQKGGLHNNDKGGKSNAGNNGTPSWQKKNNRKKKSAKPGNDNKTSGEPLPVNAADRKGG